MADYTVTYTTGAQDTLSADRYRESGEWVVFEVDGREDVILGAGAVRSIERTDPPAPPQLPGAALRWGIGAVLVVALLFSVVVGLVDMFTAQTVTARAFAAVLVVAGGLCAWGLAGLEANDEKGMRAALTGAAAALFIALVVLAVQRAGRGEELPPRVAAGAALIAAFAGASVLARKGARFRVPAVLRNVLTAGVLIGLVQFWYTNEYVPSRREAGLTETVELAASAPAPGATWPEFLTATVSLKNVSGTRIQFVGTHYALWQQTDPQGPRSLVADGTLDFGQGNWLSPDQEHVDRVVVRLPSDVRPVLTFVVSVHVLKGNRVGGLDLIGTCQDGDLTCVWLLQETSVLNGLTREPRYLVHDRGNGLATCVLRTSTTACPAPAEEKELEQSRKLGDLYGKVRVTAGSRLVLEPRPPAAATTAAPSGSPP